LSKPFNGAESTAFVLTLTSTVSQDLKMVGTFDLSRKKWDSPQHLGYNHSGMYGYINFLKGVMGMANAQRAMNYIRIITEFISQPEYRDVVPMFSIMNEPGITTIGSTELRGL
jgi:hypothetical protein